MSTTSTFFNNTFPGQSSEQSLVDSLVAEQIRIYGVDILYMPRRLMNLDKLLHESSKSAFEFAMPMPMYLKTFSGYNNGLEMLTKFGVRSSDEVTLVMSRSMWNTEYAPFVKSYYNDIKGAPHDEQLEHLDGETSRPKEGDLLYFPFDGGIFEVKYVSFDQPFFQLGKGYVYELQCEKFEYSGESFTTGYEDIDNVTTVPEYPKVVFDMHEGDGTFKMNEQIVIYNAVDIDSPEDISSEIWDALLTEASEIITTEEDGQEIDWGRASLEDRPAFKMFRDAGFTYPVPMVTAIVKDWNAVELELTVSDVSELDPSFVEDKSYIVDANKFDNVLIVGTESGARWQTSQANQAEAAFNDGDNIQEEFDDIKIIDEADMNPFGFV